MGHEDIEGIGSDLHALRNLYGLLQTNLDEKTRLFLKNLLDTAAQRVFEAHTETISSHLRDMLKQPPSNFVNVSQESSHTENSRRKKRCRVCRQSSVKQLKSIKETQYPCSKDNNINILQHDHQVIQNLPTTFSFGNGGGTYKGPQLGCFSYRPAINNSERTGKWQKQQSGVRNNMFKGISCLSKNVTAEATGDVLFEEPRHNNFTCDDQEATDVIEKIESCIMALKQVVSLAKQVGPKQLLPRDGTLLHVNNSSLLASVEPTNDMPPPQSRISPILSPAKDESNSNDCRLMSRTMKKKQDQPKTSQPPSLVSSVGSTTGSRLLDRRSLLFNKYNDEEDGSSSSRRRRRRKSSPISHKHYLHRRNNQARLGFPRKKTSVISTESDNGTASSLLCRSSSSWRSERGVNITRTSNSSEEYDSLTTGETRSRYYTSPSTGSSSNNILPSTTRARLPAGFTSSSNDLKSNDQDSTTSHRRAYTGGVPAGSITKMSKTGIGLTRKNNKGHSTRPEKQVGRLRKLKDKLAIIFHHHHHHHHHHHKDMEGHREKQLAVENVRKSGLVHNLSSQVKKKQEGHFRSLAEGLLNHLRHSKKSKVGTRPLEKGKHVAVKKLHWWEMLHHQRGAKLSNFRTQPRVKRKALPKIK